MRRGLYRRWAGAALAVCGLAVLAAGGCATSNSKLQEITSEDNFREVIKSQPLVLVDFYKGGCPTCAMLDGSLDKLFDEYQGRVLMTRFQILTSSFSAIAKEVQKEYRVAYFPTVVLFVNGQEKKRWTLELGADKYRKVLDEMTSPAKVEPAAEKPAAEPAKPPALDGSWGNDAAKPSSAG